MAKVSSGPPTNPCNEPLQRTPATNPCNEPLQRPTATRPRPQPPVRAPAKKPCNQPLQRTPATNPCNEPLQRTPGASRRLAFAFSAPRICGQTVTSLPQPMLKLTGKLSHQILT